MENPDSLAKELVRLFHHIYGEDFYYPELPIEIHDYVAIVKRAVMISSTLHEFLVGRQAIWDKAEEDFKNRGDDDFNFFIASALQEDFGAQYEQLDLFYKQLEKLEDMKAYKLDDGYCNTLKSCLNGVHPLIIEKLFATTSVSGIYYNVKTGVGWVRGKRFSFRATQKKNVFSLLYERMNEPVLRSEILEAGKYDPKRAVEVYFMKDLANDLRRGTSLTADELILNESLTLQGIKLNSPPKSR